VVELSNQLRGRCGKRQVPNAKVGMQHNIGIGGAGVVALYRMAQGGSTRPASSPSAAPSGGSLKSDAIFKEIQERAAAEKDLVKNVKTSFRITVSGAGGITKVWTIDLKQDPPSVTEGPNKSPVEIELQIKDDDFVAIAAGKLKPDQAFMQGKMKVKGNIAKALKLKTVLDPKMLKAKL